MYDPMSPKLMSGPSTAEGGATALELGRSAGVRDRGIHHPFPSTGPCSHHQCGEGRTCQRT